MEEFIISTGQASKLCSVTRDTILKWINKGTISAERTAGGHYRINKDTLKPYIVTEKLNIPKKYKNKKAKFSYCWEYYSADGNVKEGCRECMVFKLKAEKCFLTADLGNKTDHNGIYCKSSCYECEYFKYINKPELDILLITENEKLIAGLKSDISKNIILKFSDCGYETATIIQDFRPDFIVIDESMPKEKSDEICNHLIEDPRIHGAQIILATSGEAELEKLQEGVCATISVPFSAKELEKCFNKLRSSLFGGKN